MAGLAEAAPRGEAQEARQLVVFALGDERLALPMSVVREIVRMLPLQPVPTAPAFVLGVANLRGRVLPVLDLRRLVGEAPHSPDEATRVLVLDWRGHRLGLVVDRVLKVMEARAESTVPARAGGALLGSDALAGVVREADGGLVQVLAPGALIDGRLGEACGAGAQPPAEPVSAPAWGTAGTCDPPSPSAPEGEADEGARQIVVFHAAGREFALPISEVDEILRLPGRVEAVPGAGGHAVGLVDLRGSPLPLVSLPALLDLEAAPPPPGARVLVVRLPWGKGRSMPVGLVVEQVREVMAVSAAAREELPGLLARGGALAEISHVCRLDDGRRLVSVLDVRGLAAREDLRRTLQATEDGAMLTGNEGDGPDERGPGEGHEDEEQLVVFQLDGEEYGVPVSAVQEITRVPERLSRVPRTPEWVEGLVNLRGTVLPVLDMRARFGLPRTERNERQRILVIEVGGVRTGFVTDSVSEVLSVERSAIEQAPRLSEEQSRLMGRVVNLPGSGRMIVVLDIACLLDESEREALAQEARSAA